MEKEDNFIKYNIYKTKLVNYLNNKLNLCSNDIIEAFVEYYGEQHRDTIISAYEKIIFLFWITQDSILKYIEYQIDKKVEELTEQCLKDMNFDNINSILIEETIKHILFKHRISENSSSNFNKSHFVDLLCYSILKKTSKKKYLHNFFSFTINEKQKLKLIEEYKQILNIYASKLEEYEIELMKKEEYKINYFESLRETSGTEEKTIFLNGELIYVHNYYPFYFNIENLNNIFRKDIKNNKVHGSSTSYADKKEKFLARIILIKLFLANDETIIHEINHCISTQILLEEEDIILKSGYTMNHLKNKYLTNLDEAVTRMISKKITKLLHDKKIFILDKRFGFDEKYKLHSEKEFGCLFENFEKYIKEGYISLNSNAFIERVGKENLNEFLSTLDERNKKGTEILIRKMQKNCNF